MLTAFLLILISGYYDVKGDRKGHLVRTLLFAVLYDVVGFTLGANGQALFFCLTMLFAGVSIYSYRREIQHWWNR